MESHTGIAIETSQILLIRERKIKKYILLVVIALVISLLPLGCSKPPVITGPDYVSPTPNAFIAGPKTTTSIYNGTYTGTFICKYSENQLVDHWITVTAFTLTVTFATFSATKVPDGTYNLWITHVYCSDPIFGTGSGIDMTKGYTNTPPFEGAGGYAYLPGKTPTSVDDGIAGGADLIIDFPNGTILSTGGESPAICTVSTGGATISESSSKPSNPAWKVTYYDGRNYGVLAPSVIPSNAIPGNGAGVNAYWYGSSWSLTRVSP